jgi:hypothetical protein
MVPTTVDAGHNSQFLGMNQLNFGSAPEEGSDQPEHSITETTDESNVRFGHFWHVRLPQ